MGQLRSSSVPQSHMGACAHGHLPPVPTLVIQILYTDTLEPKADNHNDMHTDTDVMAL